MTRLYDLDLNSIFFLSVVTESLTPQLTQLQTVELCAGTEVSVRDAEPGPERIG